MKKAKKLGGFPQFIRNLDFLDWLLGIAIVAVVFAIRAAFDAQHKPPPLEPGQVWVDDHDPNPFHPREFYAQVEAVSNNYVLFSWQGVHTAPDIVLTNSDTILAFKAFYNRQVTNPFDVPDAFKQDGWILVTNPICSIEVSPPETNVLFEVYVFSNILHVIPYCTNQIEIQPYVTPLINGYLTNLQVEPYPFEGITEPPRPKAHNNRFGHDKFL